MFKPLFKASGAAFPRFRPFAVSRKNPKDNDIDSLMRTSDFLAAEKQPGRSTSKGEALDEGPGSHEWLDVLGPNVEGVLKANKIASLKRYQSKYLEDPTNLQNAFNYFRELNRNGKFDEVTKLVDFHPRMYRFPVYKFWVDPKPFHREIEEQYNYAKTRVEERGQATQKPRPFFADFLKYAIGVALLVSAWDLYSDYKELTSKGDDNDEKMSNVLAPLFGKSDASDGEKNVPTRFSDVLGIDEFKEELQELVDYLQNPSKYTQAGAKIPKGILLVGPPGTGKTLLARALAGESGCSFFYKSGSEFNEIFVGLGARRVRELFNKARKKAPAIIFIDEIDSLAGRRNAMEPSSSRDTINQILAEMDGFKQTDNIIVIGATNMEEALDPAVKRPGRFDKTIHIPVPDVRGRQEIFSYYLKKIKVDTAVDPSVLARRTTGFTGADIQNMCNLAILLSVKESRTSATFMDFEYALDRITMGIGRKKMVVSDKDKLITAYHEGGHALASLLIEGAIPLHKVTILPRGGALGYTAMLPDKDDLNLNRQSIMAAIHVALGGRAAEEIVFGPKELTTGCSSDLQKATEYAYMYVRAMGMQDDVTLISAEKSKTSDKFNYLVDKEVQKLLKASLDSVKNLMKEHHPQLKLLATELIKKETMSGKYFESLREVE